MKLNPLFLMAFSTVFVLSACGNSEKFDGDFAKEKAKIEAEEKRQAPLKRKQALLKDINHTYYGDIFEKSGLYTIELDGVKCFIVKDNNFANDAISVAISCDYNDERIAKNLVDREKTP